MNETISIIFLDAPEMGQEQLDLDMTAIKRQFRELEIEVQLQRIKTESMMAKSDGTIAIVGQLLLAATPTLSVVLPRVFEILDHYIRADS